MGKYFGVVLAVTALAGIVLAWIAGDDQRAVIDERAAAQQQALDSTETALRTADDTVAIVASIVQQVVGSLDDLEGAALESIATIDDAEDGLRKLAEISGEDLPEVIGRLNEAMPALIQVADVIDGTLGALSFVGVPYDPETPFDESLSAIAESIEGLPPQVEQQARLIDEVADGLGGIADEAGDLIIEVGVAQLQLTDGIALLDRYRSTTAEAIAAIDVERARIPAMVDSEKTAVTRSTLALLLTQSGLLLVGVWMFVVAVSSKEPVGSDREQQETQ